MKTIKFSLLGAATLALVLTFAFMTSCEKDGGNKDVSGQMADYSSDPRVDTASLNGALVISPATASVVNDGDTVIFTVTSGSTGGGPFGWSVTDDSAGTIHPIADGSQALYKATRALKNFVYVKDESSGNGGIATITYSVTTLAMTPTSASLGTAAGTQARFRAIGGAAPYTWSIVFDSLGTLSLESGFGTTNCFYTTKAAGGGGGANTNSIILTDSLGSIITGTIVQ